MIGIIKGRKPTQCASCYEMIPNTELKVKNSQDNTNRTYYHLKCTDLNTIQSQLRLWNQALQESQS